MFSTTVRSFVYILLSDIDECSLKTDDCSDLAKCINNDGSFLCDCIKGYTGEGGLCTGNDHYHWKVNVTIEIIFASFHWQSIQGNNTSSV